jgi:hypothetical protein
MTHRKRKEPAPLRIVREYVPDEAAMLKALEIALDSADCPGPHSNATKEPPGDRPTKSSAD